MDRNLGALDDRYHPAADIKAKYYQFGRKDPFNSDIYCWTYDIQTFAPSKTMGANGAREIKAKVDFEKEFKTDGHNVPVSINHPTTFITSGGEWSSVTDIFGGIKLEDNKTIKYWNDPSPYIREDNEEISFANENKSYFDPCPPGWRLPINGCFRGFIGDGNGSATGDANMNCQFGVDSEFKGRGEGRTYIPLGYLSQKDNPKAQTAFFPASGCCYQTTGGHYYVGSNGYCYSCSPNTGARAYFFYFRPSDLTPQSELNRTMGLPVRCLRE